MASHNKLPGGGPWRILSQCPAERHNTQTAAIGQDLEDHCVCPRAIHLVLNRPKNIFVKRRKMPLWLQEGPWRILEECEAPIHNTISAARGVVARDTYGKRCICPRATKLMEAYHERERERDKARWAETDRKRELMLRQAMKAMNMPDLQDAACMLEENRHLVDAGFNDDRTAAGVRDRAKAKAVCDSCPMNTFIVCQQWVKTEEDPKGSWGGVYAGEDIYERRGMRVHISGRVSAA
jgi:hypothetical protein